MGIMGYRVEGIGLRAYFYGGKRGFLSKINWKKRQGNGASGYTGVFRDQGLLVVNS